MPRLLSILSPILLAAGLASAAPSDFQPYLERHCADCHDADSQKGGLNLAALSTDGTDVAAQARWVRVFDRVTAGEMPPPKNPRPPAQETTTFLAALGEDLTASHAAHKGTVLRRLNRREYQNTVNALLGIDVEVMDLLPEDGRAQGFDTVGEALSLSAIQLQRYMEAAELALDAALLNHERPATTRQSSTLDRGRNQRHLRSHWLKRDDGAIVIFNNGTSPSTVIPDLRAATAGTYKLTVTGYGYQISKPVIFALIVTNPDIRGDASVHSFHELPPGPPTTIEVMVPLKAGDGLKISPLGLDGPSGTSPVKNGPDRYPGEGLALQEITLEGPLLATWPPSGQHLLLGTNRVRQIQSAEPPRRGRPGRPAVYRADSANPAADARKFLPPFLAAAFRRPLAPAEAEPYLKLFDTEFAGSRDFLDALRTAAMAALCSPEFLFLQEPAGPLDDHALASRLSYFLTRGPPDPELLALAASGKLASADTLRAQTNRLLDSPLRERFITDFTDGWLNLREIDFTSPDKQLYPEFDDLLRDSMLRETRAFIGELISANLGVANLIHSDFAMLNARLARHYGILGVQGLAIQKVPLPPDSKRGGLLTHASILKVSANGTNTSPVIRGVWVMSRLLGTDLPPPPPGVGSVEPDIRGATTLREQLDKHRNSASCNSCHRIIDPPGFALENYDVIGGWRHRFRSIEIGAPAGLTVDGRKVRYKLGPVVNATGELPTGQKFTTISEFQDLLLADQERIARCLADKLLTFATGRPMGFSDRPALRTLAATTQPSRYGFRDLIHAVVQSDTFRRK